MAQDAGLEFSRADVVVSISRGPPGQWFPETEHWASAIFVGTSGIPPKLNYRRVKSYRFHKRSSDNKFRRSSPLYSVLALLAEARMHWLYPLCRSKILPPQKRGYYSGYETKLHRVESIQFWVAWASKVLLYCHYSQTLSESEWKYLLRSHLGLKSICLKIVHIQ